MNKTQQRLIDIQRQIQALMNERDLLQARLTRKQGKHELQLEPAIDLGEFDFLPPIEFADPFPDA